MTKTYKREAHVPPDSSSQSHQTHREDYYRLHTTFLTMLFHKSFVAFVAAITLATSVAAAATPPATGTNQNTGSPSQDKSQLEDKTQNTVNGSSSSQPPTCIASLNPMCCDAVIPFTSLSDSFRTQLKALDPSLSESCNVGQKCAPPVGSQGWYCVPSLIFLFDNMANTPY
jgi:hypothetical protein